MDANSYASLWTLVALVLFLGLLVYLKVPGKIGAALDGRADKIGQTLADAARLREEAQALLAEYLDKTRNAEAEAAAIVAEAKAEADRLTAEATKSLEEMITRRTRAAEAKIAQAEAQAIAEVRARAADVAIAASETILAAKVKDGVGADLIAAGIGEVRAKLN